MSKENTTQPTGSGRREDGKSLNVSYGKLPQGIDIYCVMFEAQPEKTRTSSATEKATAANTSLEYSNPRAKESVNLKDEVVTVRLSRQHKRTQPKTNGTKVRLNRTRKDSTAKKGKETERGE